MFTPPSIRFPCMPDGMEGLIELALDLRWSWNHSADDMWRQISPELWDRTTNPWLILQTVASSRFDEIRQDPAFRKLLDEVLAEHKKAMGKSTWFQDAYPDSPLSVAFFCMEYGLNEALPIYSGGLGILAGDYLKTASELGVPAVGVGLLYQRGYFRQALNSLGEQLEYYPYNDTTQLPVAPVRSSGSGWLRVKIDFPGRTVWLRVWVAQIGRVNLYLLDSNDPVNNPADRGVTGELYGGGPEVRLQQEMVLGIGGWRVLEALGITPNICHLNEGHAALAVVERAHSFAKSSGQPWGVALEATRAGNIFTTHTPVEAGFDRFPRSLVERYLGPYAEEVGTSLDNLLSMGRLNGNHGEEPLNMAYLAVRGSAVVNAVSRLHEQESRRIFQPLFPQWPQKEVPVTHITNGVHAPSWDSAAADRIWTDACGKERWLGTLDTLKEDFRKVPDRSIWEFRLEQTLELILYARSRCAGQLAAAGASPQQIDKCEVLLDPNVLTIGFARRFTAYKRPMLLLKDPDRLVRIINNPRRPVQLLVAGKAHPQDSEGKAMVRAWADFARKPQAQDRVIFIADYDMALAERLVRGVDVWINTPRRPWEACGTSGMKVLVNGGLNISEMDGWWAEAYRPEFGWSIGDGKEHGDNPEWDDREAEELYSKLENEVVPCFYSRDSNGIPVDWVARIRASMAELTPRFSANRMLREYVEGLYLPAMNNYEGRIAGGSRRAVMLRDWRSSVAKYWAGLHLGNLSVKREGKGYSMSVGVYLDGLVPDYVQVQVYADPLGEGQPEIHRMERGEALAGAQGGYLYRAFIESQRPATDYTPRIVPYFEGASVPLEAADILWYQR